MKKYIYITVFLFVLLFPLLGFSQVTIAPTNLFLNNSNSFGTYMVINGSNQTQEISIDFFFTYSITDENGARRLVNEDPSLEESYSIAENVRAFPQNFTLAPSQRQIVRLRLSSLPPDLEDGTYWARIKTTSTPETPPLELQSNDAVAARVGINVEQVTGLFFKKGEVNTGINIEGIRTETDTENNRLLVLTDLARTGNSPFLGSITTTILDSSGREVRNAYISTSIYFDTMHRQDFDLTDLSPGSYTIIVKFESARTDITAQDLIPMETITESTTYVIR